VCPSKRVRDAIIDSGMEGGVQEGTDFLEASRTRFAERRRFH
jgi:hypothetical protein